MYYKQKSLFLVSMFAVALLTSCLSGLEPIPNKIGDLDLSLSIPIANAEVGLSETYTSGIPTINLGLNVPPWAKYEYIYFTDSVAVDLYRIYENSNDISYLAFVINIWNEFPVKGTLDMYFTDRANNILFQFNAINVEKGNVLYNGNVVAPGYSNSKVVFDKTLIESIRTAEFLVFQLKVNLKDGNTNVFKYYDQFKLNCHLGARVDFILKDN